MRPTVLLFDIDGTLVDTGGAGRKALRRAFADRYDRPDACDHFSFDGMTDRAIARLGLQAIGRQVTDEEIDAVLSRYVAVLEEEVRGVEDRAYLVHPGMVEALDEAAGRANVAVGLGTGNIREGARVKLQRVRLFDRFSFGGFGCDAEDRAALIRVGAERGAARLGAPLDACRVVIIGDTPKDVAAALACGGECVGVGTGAHRPEELLGAGAVAAFEDLTHPQARRALFGDA